MSNLVLRVPKDRVAEEGDLVCVDTGLTREEFVKAMLLYIGSDKDTVAIVKRDAE